MYPFGGNDPAVPRPDRWPVDTSGRAPRQRGMSAHVLTSASELSQQSERLSEEVRRFLTTVRAA